jgi:hypothetical protein
MTASVIAPKTKSLKPSVFNFNISVFDCAFAICNDFDLSYDDISYKKSDFWWFEVVRNGLNLPNVIFGRPFLIRNLRNEVRAQIFLP